jgi:hypothetical protein
VPFEICGLSSWTLNEWAREGNAISAAGGKMITLETSSMLRLALLFACFLCNMVHASSCMTCVEQSGVLPFVFPNLDHPAVSSQVSLLRKNPRTNTARNIEVRLAEGQRVEPENQASWPTEILNWGKTPWNSAPVDLSFLNLPEKPAGKRGFLSAVKDRLVFEDGTTARFWGTNLTGLSLFGMNSQEDIRLQARRLSQLGFNLVRFHHHDSFFVNPNIFGEGGRPDSKILSEAMLRRLDWWIKSLKDEGIYVWLDLEVLRQLKPSDAIESFDELSKDLKGFNYVNVSIQQAMQRFNEEYLNHFNTFTGLRYKDDPAIAFMMLTNENDVTHHFANRLLPNQKHPRHNGHYMAKAHVFAEKHGLPKNEVWRSWIPGPSKLFLNDLEHRFDVDMIEHLRAIGVKVPIVTTSLWGEDPLNSLPALTTGDLIDVHSYGGTAELERNPLHSANMMHWIAAAHLVDRPLSVTEWNVTPFPVSDRHTIPLYIASSASLQGWDAMMQFAYSSRPVVDRGRPSNWHAFNDPALMATLPAAALLYRRHDVQEANTLYVFAPTEAQLFNRDISPENAVALRTAAEKGKLLIAMPRTKELPWLEQSRIPVGANVITDSEHAIIDSSAKESVSENGQLRRNWEQGIYTINTPRSEAAMGRIGGKSISLADVDIAISTPSATVAIQSIDGKSIGESGAILISLGARSVPKAATETPFYSEPVIGRLTIRARKGLKLYPQRGTEMDETAIDAPYEDGRYQVTLDRTLGTYWLLLK